MSVRWCSAWLDVGGCKVDSIKSSSSDILLYRYISKQGEDVRELLYQFCIAFLTQLEIAPRAVFQGCGLLPAG